jgi:hypothetical protein
LKTLPSTLIRFFKQEDHALQFISGEVRFGLLSHYRTVEGTRQDTQEGLVSHYWTKKAPQLVFNRETGELVSAGESDQNIHFKGSSLNPYFILSTSHSDADKGVLAEQFGRFIVQISDPIKLRDRIEIAWLKHAWSLEGAAFIAPVVYNKGEVIEADPYLISPPEYNYCQKEPRYQHEREFRYVLTCSVDTERKRDDFLVLFLPDCSDILSLEVFAPITALQEFETH